MYAVRLSDRDGSHYVDRTWDELSLAGAFAVHNSIGREHGAEVVEITAGANGKRVAEFFEGRQIETIACDVPITGVLGHKLAAR